MEKKLSRQILYRPGKPVSQTLEEKANVQVENITVEPKPKITPSTSKELSIKERSQILYEWLKAHPLINLNGLCKKTGIDRANFIKWSKSEKELKPETLTKFSTELNPYGYAI